MKPQHLKWYFLAVGWTPHRLIIRTLLLSSSTTPSQCLSWWGLVVNTLKMHFKGKIRGQQSWLTFYCCYKSYFPAFPLFSLLWLLCLGHPSLLLLQFALTSAPLDSSLRLFNSQSPHKTADFIWLIQYSAWLLSYVSVYKSLLTARAPEYERSVNTVVWAVNLFLCPMTRRTLPSPSNEDH